MCSRVCGTAPKFYGKRVSLKIFFRRKLGREKKLRAIRKIGHKERRIVNGLHKIAKNREAEKHNAAIAIGNLELETTREEGG